MTDKKFLKKLKEIVKEADNEDNYDVVGEVNKLVEDYWGI